MYEIELKFAIVGSSPRIVQTLQALAPLEDCVYHITACPDTGRLSDAATGNGSAVIFGSEVSARDIEVTLQRWQEEARSGNAVPLTVAIAVPGHLDLPAGLCRRLDQLWMIGADEDAAVLQACFEKLARLMKEREDARKQAICFQTLIDSSQDLIWFKDVSGRHLIVNDQFCRFVRKSKAQIYKQGHCYIWNASKEDEQVCLESDRKIMLGRKTLKFEEQVHTNDGDYIIQSDKSPLIDEGTIFGTCGIGKNVTAEKNLERKLQTILDNIPFAVAVVSNSEILTYKNKMFDTFFPQAANLLGQPASYLKQLLHFPANLAEGETVQMEAVGPEEESIWFSYSERQILDAFDFEAEKMLVIQDITAAVRLERQKEQLAYTDYLTGLSNRRGLLRALENESDTSGLTVILLDLDDFKQINDSFGHGLGDEVLQEFANLLKKVFMADFVVRYGGDEFLVVTRLDTKESIRAKMDSLLWEAAHTVFGGGKINGISVSCGISGGDTVQGRSIEELIESSDHAMYHIKRHGKNGYWFYDDMTEEG